MSKNTWIRRLTGIGAAVAVGLGSVAMTAAPAEAKAIRSNGTVTRAESDKLGRQLEKQRCLTKREAQKITGARGQAFATGEAGLKGWAAKGKGSVTVAAVVFYGTCGAFAVTEYRNGTTKESYSWPVLGRYYEKYGA